MQSKSETILLKQNSSCTSGIKCIPGVAVEGSSLYLKCFEKIIFPWSSRLLNYQQKVGNLVDNNKFYLSTAISEQ